MGEQVTPELNDDGTPKTVVDPNAGKGAGGAGGQDEIGKQLKDLAGAVAKLAENQTTYQRTVDAMIANPAGTKDPSIDLGAGAGGEGDDEEFDFIERPKESLQKFEKRIISKIAGYQGIQDRAKKAELLFYEDNKDLKGAETIVEGVAYRLGLEQPNLQGKSYGDELAKRARAELVRLKGSAEPDQDNLPRIEPGKGDNGAAPAKPESPKAKTAEEETADYVKERRLGKRKPLKV